MNDEAASGRVLGLGLGPGDPGQVTLEVRDHLRNADAIYSPRSTRADHSRADQLLEQLGVPESRRSVYELPMHSNRDRLDRRYRSVAHDIVERVRSGQFIAACTLGDPSLYSTLGYLMDPLREELGSQSVDVVPGISAIQSIACRLGQPLARGDESVALIPLSGSDPPIHEVLQTHDAIAFLKPNKQFGDLYRALRSQDQLDSSILVSDRGQTDEQIQPLSQLSAQFEPPYFSVVLVGSESIESATVADRAVTKS